MMLSNANDLNETVFGKNNVLSKVQCVALNLLSIVSEGLKHQVADDTGHLLDRLRGFQENAADYFGEDYPIAIRQRIQEISSPVENAEDVERLIKILRGKVKHGKAIVRTEVKDLVIPEVRTYVQIFNTIMESSKTFTASLKELSFKEIERMFDDTNPELMYLHAVVYGTMVSRLSIPVKKYEPVSTVVVSRSPEKRNVIRRPLIMTKVKGSTSASVPPTSNKDEVAELKEALAEVQKELEEYRQLAKRSAQLSGEDRPHGRLNRVAPVDTGMRINDNHTCISSNSESEVREDDENEDYEDMYEGSVISSGSQYREFSLSSRGSDGAEMIAVLRGLKSTYRKDHTVVKMTQIAAMLSRDGLYVFDIVGGLHKVRLTKRQGTKVFELKVERKRGPPGRRDPRSTSVHDECLAIYPISAEYFRVFLREQRTLINSALVDATDKVTGALDVSTLLSLQQHLEKYSLIIERKIDMYVNTCSPDQHITVWSAIFFFHLVTWQTALSWDDPSYLHRDASSRWSNHFAHHLTFDGKKPLVPMRISMQLLGYVCNKAACGLHGSCETFCPQCKIGQPFGKTPSSTSEFSGTNAQRKAAYEKYAN